MPEEPTPGSPELEERRRAAVSKRARWALLTSVGIMFPVSITLSAAFGYYIDRKLGTLPWFSAIFLVFGIAAAFINLFRTLNKFEKLDAEDQKPSPPA
jgi:F0F1-type ATP synthase assembly protein I